MFRYVYYFGKKPNAHPYEQKVENLDEAKRLCKSEHFWVINEFCDYRNFDWNYDFDILSGKDYWAIDHNNIWPSQHQKDSGTWLCSTKLNCYNVYRNDVEPVIRKNIKNDFWQVSSDFDDIFFDYSWHPDPTSPPYIYEFYSVEYPRNGPKYITPNNDGTIVGKYMINEKDYPKYTIQTTLEDLIQENPNQVFWAIQKDIDYSTFDFSFKPSYDKVLFVNVFGQSENIKSQTYFLNSTFYNRGFRELNYIDIQQSKKIEELDVFYIDKGNFNSQYELLKLKYPHLQKTRYLNNYVDTICRCCNRSSSTLFWVLDSELDYTDFSFDYYPNPWQTKMLHVFGTQHNDWSGTYLVNKECFPTDSKYIKVIEHLPNINLVKEHKAKAVNCLYDIIVIDYGNNHNLVTELKQKTNRNIITISYQIDLFFTLKSYFASLPNKKDHYLWITSSVCDYSDFDFTYTVDPFSLDQLHVFPSSNQKYGDTFFLDVNKFKLVLPTLTNLYDYPINFNNSIKAKRLSCPKFVVEESHIEFIHKDFNFPYASFVTKDNQDIVVDEQETISLWQTKSKEILIRSKGATNVIIPKEVKKYFIDELYDYPYINTIPNLVDSNIMDIIFVSNKELCADENYNHLLNLKPKTPRVRDINNRTEALKAAAELSSTPWFFVVPAKLKIINDFDFSFQPDRLQIPKHYIFNAINPVTGLCYGHQAMVLYNKKLVLKNQGNTLDFTLNDPHEVTNIVCGTAVGDTDEYSTWRTAFRECIKLRYNVEYLLDKQSQNRLHVWTTVGKGLYGRYSIQGANDALEYFISVNGKIDELQKTYSWDYCKQIYNSKY